MEHSGVYLGKKQVAQASFVRTAVQRPSQTRVRVQDLQALVDGCVQFSLKCEADVGPLVLDFGNRNVAHVGLQGVAVELHGLARTRSVKFVGPVTVVGPVGASSVKLASVEEPQAILDALVQVDSLHIASCGAAVIPCSVQQLEATGEVDVTLRAPVAAARLLDCNGWLRLQGHAVDCLFVKLTSGNVVVEGAHGVRSLVVGEAGSVLESRHVGVGGEHALRNALCDGEVEGCDAWDDESKLVFTKPGMTTVRRVSLEAVRIFDLSVLAGHVQVLRAEFLVGLAGRTGAKIDRFEYPRSKIGARWAARCGAVFQKIVVA